jgi:hypothetical protein
MSMKYLMACVLLLAGCGSSRGVIEESGVDTDELRRTPEYYVLPLTVSYKPPLDWELTEEDWADWAAGWQLDYRQELRTECYKTLNFIPDVEQARGVYVKCDIYEMDKGGFATFGGGGYARAHVVIVDSRTNAVLYDGKIEGKGSSGAFETATAQGRLKFGVLNVARLIAERLETGR